ncbi:hypothetical protein HD554DRAFT_1073599 [Boletus coccyginus]|nr:hypothetical protein HD554DRAFT_1073599 [Boletus coccyginus]
MLNIVDEPTVRKIGSSPFLLVVKSLSQKTGHGSKFGTWLLERGLTLRTGSPIYLRLIAFLASIPTSLLTCLCSDYRQDQQKRFPYRLQAFGGSIIAGL